MAAKILIVEDERRTRDCLAQCLQIHGFKTMGSGSAEEAISVALGDRPDIILMDLGLPGMSGIDAARIIKQSGAISDIPIIALSSRPAHLWEHRALAAGMSLYLAKPAPVPEIVKAIRQLLRAGTAPHGADRQNKNSFPDG